MTRKSHGREVPRAELALRVRFQSRDGLEHVGVTRDLGVRGASVETQQPPLEGATVALCIDAPTSWDPIVVAGLVQWSSASARVDEHGEAIPAGFGVRFGLLSEEHANAIRALLATRGFDEG